MNNTALVGMSAAAKTMSDDERESAIEAICNESANVVQRYRHGSGISFELGTNLAMARA
jgi:hypothetical protein